MIEESDKLLNWLKSIKFEEYFSLFQNAAYDLQTVSRMNAEDLTAIGITKPEQRRKLKTEIQKLQIEDGIPNFYPSDVDSWLELIRLTDYVKKLKEQGYTTIEKVLELHCEDLEEIGIKKLGHQKRIMLAIKKLQSLAKGSSNNNNHINSGQLNHYSSASSLQSSTNLNSSLNSLNSSHSTTSKSSLLHQNLYLPLQPIYGVHNGYQAYQEVAINTNRNSKINNISPDSQSNNTSVNSSKSIGSLINSQVTPTTPELKTFQQLTTAPATQTTLTTTIHSNGLLNNGSINGNKLNEHHLINGSISSSSNSLASSLNNSSNSAMNLSNNNLPPLLINPQQQYFINGHPQLINSHPQIINGQLINGQISQIPTQQVVMVNRGRSMESLNEPIYGVRQIIHNNLDGQHVQVIYANSNQLQQQQQNIYLQQLQQQQQQQQNQNSNETYLIYNNDMDGTATLNRPKSLIKNRPVAKIAAKTRDQLNGINDQNLSNDDNLTEQKQAALINQQQQIYGNFNNNNLITNNVIANNIINTNLNNGYYIDNTIYENNIYLQQQQDKLINEYNKISQLNGNNINGLQDRNSYIYATLKRGKVPPPIPKRTNSMRTNNQLPLTAPSTPSAHQPKLRRNNSLDDAQNLFNHQLNQLALAQKLKPQFNNQRSSCSELETMQEEVFATCVSQLTTRFSMNSTSLDDDDDLSITSINNSTKTKNNLNNSSTNNNSVVSTSIVNNKAISSTTINSNNKTNSPESNNNLIATVNNCNNNNNNNNNNEGVNDKKTEKIINNSLPATSNSITSNGKIDKLVIDNSNSNNLNQSTGSGDFPPLPSPSLLNNDTEDNSQQQQQNNPEPPLPSPPILEQQNNIKNLNISNSANQVKSIINPTIPLTAAQATQQTNLNNINNINRTLAAQQQFIARQQQQHQLKSNPNNQNIFRFDENNKNLECTVSSSSSTESMPFANDNVGTMRPRPNQQFNNINYYNGNVQQQLKQFASSSSSSSISSSISSITSSSTSSSLSSVSSNPSNNLNTISNSCSSSLNNNTILPVQNNINNIVQQPVQMVYHQQLPLPPPPPVPQPQNNNISLNNSNNSTSSNNARSIENVVRTSLSSISNHLNLTKLITSNSAANSALRLLGKPVQAPPDPPKPKPIKPLNWPSSPVKTLTSIENVPNINQINQSKQDINKPVTNEQNVNNNTNVNINGNINGNLINKEQTIVNSNHDNFRSQQINLQSSPLNEYTNNNSKYQSNEKSNLNDNKINDKLTNGYTPTSKIIENQENTNLDVMDDIETMLANLSTQLDAMLTSGK